mmetsp:Transcript_42754/g.50102  ORF Transcript_42754/g.50102 Transcript_42754/m.50102 type:complete len:428 (-) Transcript_42754:341-1624(-)
MSCSAYLESAAYNLERQSSAHGSFDTRSQGSLATGIGRENVTGLLPLYLFDEHWEIAKRTLPSIFGFMCTLDIMGYANDQFFVIPFTVMFKCLEKVFENPSDVNKKMLDVVKTTCVQIVKRHEKFAEGTLDKLKSFQASPAARTKDHIPNFKVFAAQVLACVEAGVIVKEDFDWPKIVRFLIEECSRRMIGKSVEPPTNIAQCNSLSGHRTTEIVAKAIEIKNLQLDQKLSIDEILEKLNGAKDKDTSEEEKKVAALIEEEVESQPWYSHLQNPESSESKSFKLFETSVTKKLNWIRVFISFLSSDSLPVPEKMSDLDCFKDDIVAYAMLFQNTLHPSNKARREAIEGNSYAEILTKQDAEAYLKKTYQNLLGLEISGEESRLITLQNSSIYDNIAEMSLLIKDILAFVEIVRGLKVGDGGVPKLIK